MRREIVARSDDSLNFSVFFESSESCHIIHVTSTALFHSFSLDHARSLFSLSREHAIRRFPKY